jgi:hypothetical protein
VVTLDGALSGGSEEIYQPDSKGWRDETIIGVHDPDHPSVPEEAALVAFGYGYGDPDNGYLVYEASHNLNSGNVQENVAAARVYGNFLLSAGIELAPRVDQVSIDGIVVSSCKPLEVMRVSTLILGLIHVVVVLTIPR